MIQKQNNEFFCNFFCFRSIIDVKLNQIVLSVNQNIIQWVAKKSSFRMPFDLKTGQLCLYCSENLKLYITLSTNIRTISAFNVNLNVGQLLPLQLTQSRQQARTVWRICNILIGMSLVPVLQFVRRNFDMNPGKMRGDFQLSCQIGDGPKMIGCQRKKI